MIAPFLRIIRWPNLLLLILIQGLVYAKLVYTHDSLIHPADALQLICITVLLAAGGYVINDYYDVDTDRINRPEDRIAGKIWTLNVVRVVYGLIVITGGLLAVWLSWRLGLQRLLFLYPIAVSGLWYYSFALKCTPVAGNVWVSLFAAGVVLIMGLPDLVNGTAGHLKPEFWWYAGFAFVSTWYREMVKDLEDIQGDATSGCRTYVVRYGITSGKVMTTLIGVVFFLALCSWWIMADQTLIRVLLLLLMGMATTTFYLLFQAYQTQHFHRISDLIKGMMLGGILIVLCLS